MSDLHMQFVMHDFGEFKCMEWTSKYDVQRGSYMSDIHMQFIIQSLGELKILHFI